MTQTERTPEAAEAQPTWPSCVPHRPGGGWSGEPAGGSSESSREEEEAEEEEEEEKKEDEEEERGTGALGMETANADKQ